jgi:hypothetical protein
MLLRYRQICLIAAIGMALLPAVAAAGTTFRKIAETGFIAKDKAPIFIWSQPQIGGTHVVFLGATGTPNAYIFTAPAGGGTVTTVVDEHTAVPGGVGTFTGSFAGYFTAFAPPNCPPPVVGTSSVVFVGRDSAGNEGLYSVPVLGGKIVKLADRNTPIPGGAVLGIKTFNASYSFCNISISGSEVVFDAGESGVYGVKTDGTHLTRIADHNTPVTIPPFPVNSFAQPSITGTEVAYIGSTKLGPHGVYVGPTTGLGKAVAIATTKPPFDEFVYPNLAGTSLLYEAALTSPNQGLFEVATAGGASSKVVDLASPLPAGTPGKEFYDIGSSNAYDGWARAGALTVFHAETTNAAKSVVYQGLFSACHGKLGKILADGDLLGGMPISPVDGVSNLLPAVVGTTASELAAIRVTSGRYQAIYVATLPAC